MVFNKLTLLHRMLVTSDAILVNPPFMILQRSSIRAFALSSSFFSLSTSARREASLLLALGLVTRAVIVSFEATDTTGVEVEVVTVAEVESPATRFRLRPRPVVEGADAGLGDTGFACSYVTSKGYRVRDEYIYNCSPVLSLVEQF